ncbi:unnamed protein product [Calicophoron daubneyi]|uniref:Uncharacterized protein n=1 Tax=Calicophoron daubneyi TaxID=300641 RepID=A0AAV2T8X7_CALDB
MEISGHSLTKRAVTKITPQMDQNLEVATPSQSANLPTTAIKSSEVCRITEPPKEAVLPKIQASSPKDKDSTVAEIRRITSPLVEWLQASPCSRSSMLSARRMYQKESITLPKACAPTQGQLRLIAFPRAESHPTFHSHRLPCETQDQWCYANYMRNTLGIRLVSPNRSPRSALPYGRQVMLRKAHVVRPPSVLTTHERPPRFTGVKLRSRNTSTYPNQGKLPQSNSSPEQITISDLNHTAQSMLEKLHCSDVRQNFYLAKRNSTKIRGPQKYHCPLNSFQTMDRNVSNWMDGLVEIRQVTAQMLVPKRSTSINHSQTMEEGNKQEVNDSATRNENQVETQKQGSEFVNKSAEDSHEVDELSEQPYTDAEQLSNLDGEGVFEEQLSSSHLQLECNRLTTDESAEHETMVASSLEAEQAHSVPNEQGGEEESLPDEDADETLEEDSPPIVISNPRVEITLKDPPSSKIEDLRDDNSSENEESHTRSINDDSEQM